MSLRYNERHDNLGIIKHDESCLPIRKRNLVFPHTFVSQYSNPQTVHFICCKEISSQVYNAVIKKTAFYFTAFSAL